MVVNSRVVWKVRAHRTGDQPAECLGRSLDLQQRLARTSRRERLDLVGHHGRRQLAVAHLHRPRAERTRLVGVLGGHRSVPPPDLGDGGQQPVGQERHDDHQGQPERPHRVEEGEEGEA